MTCGWCCHAMPLCQTLVICKVCPLAHYWLHTQCVPVIHNFLWDAQTNYALMSSFLMSNSLAAPKEHTLLGSLCILQGLVFFFRKNGKIVWPACISPTSLFTTLVCCIRVQYDLLLTTYRKKEINIFAHFSPADNPYPVRAVLTLDISLFSVYLFFSTPFSSNFFLFQFHFFNMILVKENLTKWKVSRLDRSSHQSVGLSQSSGLVAQWLSEITWV